MFEKFKKPEFSKFYHMKSPFLPQLNDPRLYWIKGPIGIFCLGLLFVLLIVSIYFTIDAFSQDTQKPEENVLASYQQTGQFDYLTYLKPDVDDSNQGSTSFFRNIVETIDIVLSYKFVPDQPVTVETSEVQINAILSAPGNWQKEITLVPRTPQQPGEFTMQFPLDVAAIEQYFETIATELGFRSKARDVTLVAEVFTKGRTGTQILNDTFTTSMNVDVSSITIGLEGLTDESQRGYVDGIGYSHLGRFGYDVKLGPNSLFGPITLESKIGPSLIRTAGPCADIDIEFVDSIDFTFAYDFQNDTPIKSMKEDVEIFGVLENPGKWSESIDLVPKTSEVDVFTVDFHVDPAEIETWAQQKDSELMIDGGAKHNFNITAKVHTLAQTGDDLQINEFFNQTFGMALSKNAIEFGNEPGKNQSGSITDMIWVTDPSVGAQGLWASLSTGILLLIFCGTVFIFYQVKPPKLPRAEQEAKSAKRKHKSMILDVKSIPPLGISDGLVQLSSLTELVKIADGMAVPILHKNEEGSHIYLIIAENAKFVYMSGDKNHLRQWMGQQTVPSRSDSMVGPAGFQQYSGYKGF